ncbi:hypothetical protein [Oceanospirillum sp.]|uniref:hypothetical protein n=1 Tax=Oceanospirillum sp. TaxID=2021254 RepID=UPI003A8F6470
MEWRSQKGQERLNNSDAAAIVSFGSVIGIVVVDAAESGQSYEFANLWAKRCVELVEPEDLFSSESLILKIQSQWRSLRLQYLYEKASYSLVVVDTKARKGLLMFVGDVRAGLRAEGEGIDWLNLPHTVEFQFLQHDSATEMAVSARHQLTRCYKAKRFDSPELVPFQWNGSQDLILCTDGYWREHLLDNVLLSDLKDDSSVLRLSKRIYNPVIDSDVDNFYLQNANVHNS